MGKEITENRIFDSVLEHKRWCRKELRELAKTLGEDYREEAGEAICRKVIELDEFKAAESVFCYINLPGEPSTKSIIEKAVFDGKKVSIPLCTDTSEHIMSARLYEGEESLVSGAYGIMEPSAESKEVDPAEIDLVIAPCVSCDRWCRRLGHGAGYYDRFLSRTDCRVVALCYEKMLCEEVPTEEFDITMYAVITENNIYRKE
ncbi:MAG: 5-formyltetrahydrofolate cyclo-ligase [Mogibacterium sp.]|nr:5-formyltetrahydrofolate cyclo-ligase [Mogibacterium sp.]